MAEHMFIAKKVREISREEVDFLFSILGAEKRLRGKKKIFVKPNIFAPEKAKTGATCDFDLISHVVDWLNEHDKTVYMGEVGAHQYDSEELFQSMGVYDRFDAEFINLNFAEVKEVTFTIKGSKHAFKVPKIVLDCDGVVNMPKYKTHGATVLSMAIKNFFGLLPGNEKWKGHALGLNETLYSITQLVPSDVVITDGFIAMEGFGPTLGVPVKKGLLFASDSAVTHDVAVSQVLGVDLEFLKFYNVPDIHKDYYDEDNRKTDDIDFRLRMPPKAFSWFWYHVNQYFYKYGPYLEKGGVPPAKILNFLVNERTIQFWRSLQK
jgi:uncharacterized protein (DUF362 family)